MRHRDFGETLILQEFDRQPSSGNDNSKNMDRTYYASVEAGKRNISLANIEKIANGFNITIAELFEGL